MCPNRSHGGGHRRRVAARRVSRLGQFASNVGADAGAARPLTFDREPIRAPVGFTGAVVVDAREADTLEPPRGSWADVSLVVVAVRDHRKALVELAGRRAVEQLEWDVDRAGQMFVVVLVRRQHFDELAPFVAYQALNFVAVDRRCISALL